MTSCGGNCSCSKRQRRDIAPASTENDDIWLSDGDEQHFKPADAHSDEIFGDDINAPDSVETSALRRAHAKQGFIEGLTEAKAKSTQTGFDEGYKHGSVIGLRVGKILSHLNCLKHSENEAIAVEATQYIEQAKKELFITNVLSVKYFDEDVNLGKNGHEVINKWDEIVELLLAKLHQVN